MANNANKQQDSFTDGVSKFAEATRHSMTASRLAMAGVVALGAAGTAYFSDPEASRSEWHADGTAGGDDGCARPGSGGTSSGDG